VELFPTPSVVDKDEPLTVSLVSYYLDMVVDMVISLIGILEPDISALIEVVDMFSLQSIFIPSSKDILENMIDIFPLTCIPSRASSSWKA